MSDPLQSPPREETLDPPSPAEWARFRHLAHRMVDDMLDHLSAIREQPVWQPLPENVRAAFGDPVPLEGEGNEAAYESFLRLVRPYPNGNLHPRFWGWVQGNGTPIGMMADMLASGLNPHLAGIDQGPALVEHQVLEWLTQLMGFPPTAGGLMVTGGSMANVLGLAVARYAACQRVGLDVREHGLQPVPGRGAAPNLLCYGSTETHSWARKAIELLGLGNNSLRRIPVDPDYRINLQLLKQAVAQDRRAGALPCCVIATAGTVNTGATDDLRGIAEFCRDEEIWFTSTEPSARWFGYRTRFDPLSRESSSPILWLSISINGDTCLSSAPACWCGIQSCIARRSRRQPVTSGRPRAAPLPEGCHSPTAA